jgi:uncharacterized protein (DUF2141 family)
MIKFILIFAFLFAVPPSKESDVRVELRGIRNAKGNLALLLFNKKEGFPSDHTKAIRQLVVPAAQGKVILQLNKLPFDTYALAVIHDENDNLQLDTNWLGIPKEGYGFSGNKMGLMGPPAFGDAAFSVHSADQQVVIDIKY